MLAAIAKIATNMDDRKLRARGIADAIRHAAEYRGVGLYDA